MYNGQTRFTRGRRIVVNRRSGIAGVVGDDTDELSEVAVTSKFVALPPPIYPPSEYDALQTIEVSGTHIPWWAWGVAGALGFALLNSFSRSK